MKRTHLALAVVASALLLAACGGGTKKVTMNEELTSSFTTPQKGQPLTVSHAVNLKSYQEFVNISGSVDATKCPEISLGRSWLRLANVKFAQAITNPAQLPSIKVRLSVASGESGTKYELGSWTFSGQTQVQDTNEEQCTAEVQKDEPSCATATCPSGLTCSAQKVCLKVCKLDSDCPTVVDGSTVREYLCNEGYCRSQRRCLGRAISFNRVKNESATPPQQFKETFIDPAGEGLGKLREYLRGSSNGFVLFVELTSSETLASAKVVVNMTFFASTDVAECKEP